MGANGGIGGSYGVMPELFVKLEESIQKTELIRAREIQAAVNDIIERMYALSSFCGAAKEIIKIRYMDIGKPRLPQAKVAEAEKNTARGIADRIVAYIDAF